MKKLTDAQLKAAEHIDSEALRWQRMSARCKDIGMHLMATTCAHVAKELKDSLEMQLRLLKCETIIPENWKSQVETIEELEKKMAPSSDAMFLEIRHGIV